VATAAVWIEDYGVAAARARRAAELFAAAGDREGRPQALLALAAAQYWQGDNAAVVATADTIIGLLTDPATAPEAAHIIDFTMANALSQKGRSLLVLDRPTEAESAYAQARRTGARAEVPILQATAALGQARALDVLGERERALATLREAIVLAEAAGDTIRKAEATALLADWADAATD
jgi:tetratricopeptide (TPR) repeat protein